MRIPKDYQRKDWYDGCSATVSSALDDLRRALTCKILGHMAIEQYFDEEILSRIYCYRCDGEWEKLVVAKEQSAPGHGRTAPGAAEQER